MPASPDPTLAPKAPIIDACWQRIGVHGDRSCERLLQHVHCHNCERHAEAALQLLDRHEQLWDVTDSALPSEGQAAEPLPEKDAQSVLVFRLGQNWLAVPSALLLEVTTPITVHKLPYPRNRALRGLCNVRGTLVPCLALDIVLGLSKEATPQDRSRMLILDAPGGALVAEVQAVEGIYALPQTQLQRTHQTSGLAASQLASAVTQWQQRSVTVLDTDRLSQALLRSLG